MKFRVCNSCEEELELCEDNFYRNTNAPDGYDRKCKDCFKKDREVYQTVKTPKPRERIFRPGFDVQCDKDRLKRLLQNIGSIYKEAF